MISFDVGADAGKSGGGEAIWICNEARPVGSWVAREPPLLFLSPLGYTSERQNVNPVILISIGGRGTCELPNVWARWLYCKEKSFLSHCAFRFRPRAHRNSPYSVHETIVDCSLRLHYNRVNHDCPFS